VKTQKANNQKKKSQKANPFPYCGDFQKMAEMMKSCCPGEGDTVDCCSIIRRMMGRGTGAEDRETKATKKPQKGAENG
jgi:hypothetical protein